MGLKSLDHLELAPSADMHVHLRQDKMMELVVPQIRNGGVDTVFVMVSPLKDLGQLNVTLFVPASTDTHLLFALPV